jgi:hypothetical protein
MKFFLKSNRYYTLIYLLNENAIKDPFILCYNIFKVKIQEDIDFFLGKIATRRN